MIEKNKNLAFHKILNPWIITTPPGYSTLFVPPLNNSDDRFSIIAGIVDTDTFKNEINFPIVINGDKYEILDTIIERGTPYVQCIPFKRDAWKMEIKTIEDKFIGVLSVEYTKEIVRLDMESINHLQVHASSIGGVLMSYLQ